MVIAYKIANNLQLHVITSVSQAELNPAPTPNLPPYFTPIVSGKLKVEDCY